MSHWKSLRPEERGPVLTETRDRKMAASAHAFVRGSTQKFYEWLEETDPSSFPQGPDTWICGDCHVGNLGPVASRDGRLAVQIRDLDQTVIGNPAHDLIRLGLSLAMAARGSALPGITTAHIIERLVDGYEKAFAGYGDAETPLPEVVRSVLRHAAGRNWKHLADERIEGTSPVIPIGRRFWPLSGPEREAVEGLFSDERLHQLASLLRSREEGSPIRVMDAAYWRKGCSSLGRLRFAVLIAVGRGHHERHCLMDVKEAIAAAAPASPRASMPDDNAERVVSGARALSPYLGGRMLPARLLGKSVFVRELLPQDLKFEIEHLSREEATRIAEYLAGIVGLAHARQMSMSDRGAWMAELARNRSRTLDAPSWLWDSVVDLAGIHESAYLQHCRRLPMAEVA